MGGCFSDVRGGKQAVGVGLTGPSMPPMPTTDAALNDAVDHFFRARGLHQLFTHLELSLSGSGLRDRDIISKSDPMVVVYTKKRDGTLEELGRTEVIMNSLDPAWIKKITVAYHFEIVQPLIR